MLAALGTWFASQGVGLVLGALAKLLLDGFNSWQSNQAQRQAGANETAARTSAATVETQDAMDEIPRPSDTSITDSLRSGKF